MQVGLEEPCLQQVFAGVFFVEHRKCGIVQCDGLATVPCGFFADGFDLFLDRSLVIPAGA